MSASGLVPLGPGKDNCSAFVLTVGVAGRSVGGSDLFAIACSGLNQNSYLWKTLPSYGELLTQYYGTGHYSLDNYVSLVSGQAPTPDNANTWLNTPTDTAQSVVACCNELPGPNTTQPGFQAFGQDTTPGGGITGAVTIPRFIKPGSVSQQPYNHYSWLRSMEDLFGITTGGTDGHGHLGYAAACAPSARTCSTTPPARRWPRLRRAASSTPPSRV